MSLVLLVPMIVYGAVRTVLWLRGQWRFHALRRDLPRARPPVAAPAHLGEALTRLLVRSHAGRVQLVECARTIATVLIVDPDVPLGAVRDFRFRVALADAWIASAAWLRAHDELDEYTQRRLADHGYTPRSFRQRRASLGEAVHRHVRAPALEPFAVDDVIAVQQLVQALIDDLEGCERALLARPRNGPYRGAGGDGPSGPESSPGLSGPSGPELPVALAGRS